MHQVYGVDSTPAALGWPPLLDWLREHGLDPGNVRSVQVDPETRDSRCQFYQLRDGKRFTEDGERAVTATERFTAIRPLPRDAAHIPAYL